MKTFDSKPVSMMAEQWNGGKEENFVGQLIEAGWSVFFQQPDVETIETYNHDTNQYETVPCPPRMLIVGPYRGQVTKVEPGNWVIWHDGDTTFTTWVIPPKEGAWTEREDGEFKPPTPFTMNTNKNTGEPVF